MAFFVLSVFILLLLTGLLIRVLVLDLAVELRRGADGGAELSVGSLFELDLDYGADGWLVVVVNGIFRGWGIAILLCHLIPLLLILLGLSGKFSIVARKVSVYSGDLVVFDIVNGFGIGIIL